MWLHIFFSACLFLNHFQNVPFQLLKLLVYTHVGTASIWIHHRRSQKCICAPPLKPPGIHLIAKSEQYGISFVKKTAAKALLVCIFSLALQLQLSPLTNGKRWNQGERAAAQKSSRVTACGSSLEDRVPLCMANCFYRNSAAWPSCARARIPLLSTNTSLTASPGFSVSHSHTHAQNSVCILTFTHQVPSVETTNKGSYLPLVPALFCQVTSFVSFLLSASLTLLLSLAPSLPLALPLFLWSLALPSLSLPLSLSFGGQACLLGLFPGFFPSEGHSGSFFHPLSLAQSHRGLILIPSGRPPALLCVWTVVQFVIILMITIW